MHKLLVLVALAVTAGLLAVWPSASTRAAGDQIYLYLFHGDPSESFKNGIDWVKPGFPSAGEVWF